MSNKRKDAYNILATVLGEMLGMLIRILIVLVILGFIIYNVYKAFYHVGMGIYEHIIHHI